MVFCFEARHFHILGYGNDQACLRKRQGAIVAQLFSPLFFCMRSRGGASETKLTLRANRRCKKKAWESDFWWGSAEAGWEPHQNIIIIATVPFPCPFTHLPILFSRMWSRNFRMRCFSFYLFQKKNYFLLYVACNTIEWGDSDIFKCDFISVGDSE